MKSWHQLLVDEVSKKEDKDLFKEAIGSYLSGYYRASYIMTWVAIVESLKSKIYEYADLENKVASKAIINIEKAEKEKRSVDQKIIEEARNCDILDENEYQMVEFLWRQRCIFAHPYQKRPSEEEIKLALYKAVEIVLSRNLMFSKPLIEELIENIISKPHFLSNDLVLVEKVAIENIARVPKKLYPFFFKTLMGKVGQYENDQSKALLTNKLRVYIVSFLSMSDVDLTSAEYGLEYRAVNFPYTSFVGYVHSKTWPKISERIKNILFDYILTVSDVYKLNIIKNLVRKLIIANVLEENYMHLYTGLLDSDIFLKSINFYGNFENVYRRIKTELLAGSFVQQNVVLDFLNSQTGVDILAMLDDSNQQDLGKVIYYCAEEGNWKAQMFVDHILKNITLYPVYLKQGVCIGVFIDKRSRLSINFSLLSAAAKLIDSLSINVMDDLFNVVHAAIDYKEKEGGKIYVPGDKLNLLKNELVQSEPFLYAQAREHLQHFFMKIAPLLGDERDLPF